MGYNGREGDANIQLRLDRALGTESLLLLFPFYRVIHAKRYNSDNFPLFIEMNQSALHISPSKKFFRFEESWSREPKCTDRIKSAWKKRDDLMANLKKVK